MYISERTNNTYTHCFAHVARIFYFSFGHLYTERNPTSTTQGTLSATHDETVLSAPSKQGITFHFHFIYTYFF